MVRLKIQQNQMEHLHRLVAEARRKFIMSTRLYDDLIMKIYAAASCDKLNASTTIKTLEDIKGKK